MYGAYLVSFRSQTQCCLFYQDFPEPQLPEETVAAFQTAFDNIHAFHDAQQKSPLSVETMPGVNCRRLTRPIGETSDMSSTM